jgi:hypothetical protein
MCNDLQEVLHDEWHGKSVAAATNILLLNMLMTEMMQLLLETEG